ncbi:MAG: histidinol-phosphate transaminase [bacterium]|nr:histidinol-phosphate transaminase [bacterium]
MSLADRVKPHIASLEPYQPGKPIEELERELGIANAAKLASNENPLGPSPKAIKAIQQAAQNMHRYPDGASYRLRNALAERLDLSPAQLVFGSGSSEVLELLAKAFISTGDEVVFAWPSFSMYPIVTQGMGGTPIQVPLDENLAHDLPAMADAVTERTQVVIVCNPNNPTGTSVGAAAFDAFVESLPEDVVLVVDEAYVEYARRPDFPDALGWVARRPGTLVTRTFSKLNGLAGVRVGYGIADPELAGYLERARHPFNLNLLAEAAALAALDDVEHIEATRRMNAEGGEQLTRGLEALGFKVWPTDANFLLAELGDDAYEKLLHKGVIVRPMGGFGLLGCVRISIGTAEENEKLIKVVETWRGTKA